MKKQFLLFSLFSPIYIFAQNIKGIVTNATTLSALNEVKIEIIDTDFQAKTTENGVFKITDLPVGEYAAKVSVEGYETQTIRQIQVVKGVDVLLEVILQPSDNQLNTISVVGERQNIFNQLQNNAPLTVAQTIKQPAAFNDPARLAMNVAGVSNPNDQSNGLSINGYNPDFMNWRLEGATILNPNHLATAGVITDFPATRSGGINALSAQLLGTSSLVTAGYSGEYGNVISGVMDMRLRNGNDEKHRMTTQIGLVGLDFAAEGPLAKSKKIASKSSYLVNYRYSTVGLLSKLGVPLGNEKSNFQDFSWHLNFPNKTGGGVKIFGVHGNSINDYIPNKDSILNERDFTAATYSGRLNIVGLNWKQKLNEKMSWEYAAAYSTTFARTSIDNYGDSKGKVENGYYETMFSQFGALNYKISKHFTSRIGLNTQYYDFYGTGRRLIPFVDIRFEKNRFSTQMTLQRLFGNYNSVISDFGYGRFLPRVMIGYRIDESQRLTFAYQKSSINHQFDLVYQRRTEKNLFKANAFYHIERKNGSSIFLAESLYSNIFELTNIVNNGINFTFQQQFANNFSVASTLGLYNVKFNTETGESYHGFYSGKYNMNINLAKEWRKENRTLGIALHTFNAGANYFNEVDDVTYNNTPIINQWSFNNIAVFQNYFRTDLRLYKTKIKKNRTSTVSLDIQNVTNQKNIAFIYYDNILKRNQTRYQNGLIPILAWRLNF